MKKTFFLFLILNFTRFSLSAQEQQTIDFLFSDFIQTEYFQQITDTLPNLFYQDSTLWTVSDLELVQSVIGDDSEIPISIGFKEWKLIHWNNIPPRGGTKKVQIFSKEKCFNKYEITISIPLLNPYGHKRGPGECCEDTHYLLGKKYTIREKKGELKILESHEYCYLNRICIKFI